MHEDCLPTNAVQHPDVETAAWRSQGSNLCTAAFALFCVGVQGMEATESACRVLVGRKLKSRKDILLDTKVQYLLRVILLSIFLYTKQEYK